MIRSVEASVVLFSFLLPGLAPAAARAEAPGTPALEKDLREAMRETGGRGGVLAVKRCKQPAEVAAGGAADALGTRPVTTDDAFRIGSITKTFVAVLVLQLVEDGKIGLDDPVVRHLPGFPGDGRITVRQLLNHTSGLPDYLGSERVRAGMQRPWTPDALVAAGVALPSKLGPGEDHDYSNTNYIVLGQLLEKAGDGSFEAQLRRRVLDPLKMRNTWVDGAERPRRVRVRGTERLGNGRYVNVDDAEHLSVAWTAGAMVSTAEDLLAFSQGLFEGTLLKPETRAAMLASTPLPGGRTAPYGFGIMIENGPLGPFYGHGGSIPGFTSDFGYMPSQCLHVAGLSNAWNADAAMFTTAAIRRLLPPPPRSHGGAPSTKREHAADGPAAARRVGEALEALVAPTPKGNCP